MSYQLRVRAAYGQKEAQRNVHAGYILVTPRYEHHQYFEIETKNVLIK